MKGIMRLTVTDKFNGKNVNLHSELYIINDLIH